MIRKAADTERYATAVEDTAGVYLVPAFTGIGAPYWDPYARGTVVGITRGCKKNILSGRHWNLWRTRPMTF